MAQIQEEEIKSLVDVAVLQNDVQWIKRFLQDHVATKAELREMEGKVDKLQESAASKDELRQLEGKVDKLQESAVTKDELRQLEKKFDKLEGKVDGYHGRVNILIWIVGSLFVAYGALVAALIIKVFF